VPSDRKSPPFAKSAKDGAPSRSFDLWRMTGTLPEVTPVMQFVGVFYPAVAYIGTVVHVGDKDILDAGIDLGLGLLHGLAGADYDQDNAGSACNQPLFVYFFYVFDVDTFCGGPLENNGGVFRERVEGFFIVKREWRNDDAHTDLKAAFGAPLGLKAIGQFPEKIADGRQHAFLLDADGGIAEARSEFEGIDAVVVDDAVYVDVANVALFGKFRLHLEQSAIEERVGFAPEHGGAHFAGRRTNFTRKKFFVLEIDVDGRNEFFAVEETTDGHFYAGNAALQLKDFDFVGEGAFVGFEHTDNVVSIFFFANEKAALDVLGFSARLDDVAVGIFLDEFDGAIEVVEFLVRNDGDAGFLQFFLAERAIVFEIVGVNGAADDGLPCCAEGLGAGALAESVVKNDDIGPFVGVFFPIERFGDETVGDVAFFFILDVIADVVTFFKNLPGNIADEA
jgi:hypothetical protein